MTNQNVQSVQNLFANFGQGNLPGVLEALTDDITWIEVGEPEIAYGGVYKGKEEVQGFFMKLVQSIEYSQLEPQKFVAEGDDVVVIGVLKGKVKANDKTFSSDWVMHFQFRDGKVCYFHTYEDTNNIAKAFK